MYDSLAHEFDGRLLGVDAPEYEPARLDAIWNGRKTTRRPIAILIAASVADVQRGVRLAIEKGWQIGIRSGGHSWIATGVREGALLIDLSRLTDLTVDAARRQAVVQPGVRGSDLNILLAKQGLAFPSGHCSSVCVGGYLLGGGYGWNSRTLGPACLSIEAADVVLADGSLVHADDDSHPELMWALRGAGPGFFGIVVAFHLRLHPGYEQILLSTVTVGEELREEALAWSYDALPTFPSGLEVVAETRLSAGSAGSDTTFVATGFVSPGVSPDELFAEFEAAPFRGEASDRVGRVPVDFPGIYGVLDTKMPQGRRFAVDGVWTSAPAAQILAAGASVYATVPSAESYVLWLLWGHYPTEANACWSTQGALYFSPNALWRDESDDLRHERWAHASLNAFTAAGIDAGTQFSDANPADRPAAAISPDNARRLEQLRGVWDPDRRLVSYLQAGESTTRLGAAIRDGGTGAH